MLSCSMKRQNSRLIPQRTHWRTCSSPASASAAFARTRNVSDSSSSIRSGSGGGPIKHQQSARQGTPRFCPAPSLAAVPPVRGLVPHCNLLGFSSFAYSFRPTAHSLSSFPLPHNPQSGLDKAYFSTSRAVMAATKIDGTAIAKRIRASLHTEIHDKKRTNPRYIPSLKIIQGSSSPNTWQLSAFDV